MLLGAFGDPGHAFPMIALGCALAARGHDVTLQTWERWRAPIEAEGLTFAPAPEYQRVSFRSPEPLDFYEAVVHATRDTLPLGRRARARCRRRRHPHARPLARRRARGRPLRDADPPCLPPGRARTADLLARRPPAAHLGRSRLLAPCRPARRARSAARARTSSTTPARALACRRSTTPTAAPAASSRSSPRFPSSSIRAPGPVSRACRRTAHVGAPGGGCRAASGR